MKRKIYTGILISLIFIAGFYLRFLYLNTPLWYDEACSWQTAIQSFPFGIMHDLLNNDLQHTPFYFFILHFWIKIFSQSEIAMRSLSFIFAIAAMPLVYIISNKLFSKKCAIYSCAIFSVSPILVLFSEEVRMYQMVIFLVLLSVNFLIDFEQKEKTSSLIKMTVTNILIPYTFVGGIFYNFALLISYFTYLLKNKKEYLKKFALFEFIEWLLLIPYFILICYYAKIRSTFIVSHEGAMHFSAIVDVIRNFFGATITPNVYWPSDGTYEITFLFTILVILPCVYFINGFVKNFKNSNKFNKTLAKIFIICLVLAIIFAMLKVNVLTVRYVLFILPPVIILATGGLISNLKNAHANSFFSLFIIASLIFSIFNAKPIRINKENAFKNPAQVLTQSGIDYRDVVIMPFGSDAPYYFKNTTSPVIFNADFHKIARVPQGIYYDPEQKEKLTGNQKYKFILEKINEDNVFSNNFTQYFKNNVTKNVENGRYAILIMYGEDNNIIKPIQTLRENIKTENDVKNKILYTMFSKYMCDVAALLNADFKYINTFTKDNFTYYIYQKKSE